MLWIIIMVVLIVLGYILGYHEDGIGFGILCGICGLLTGILITFASAGIICCVNNPELHPDKYTCKEIYEEYEICALQDNFGTSVEGSGTFFLGCGGLTVGGKSELYYGYFVETDKGKLYEQIKATKAYVNEIEEGQPRVITHIKDVYMTKSKFMRDWLWWDEQTVKVDESVLYIPKGTIKYDYSIDLQ